MGESIIVLDFGSQYSQLIARRIRECHVYSRIVPYTISADEVRDIAPHGIVLSGGPSSVYGAKAPLCAPDIFTLNIPVMGICYGMQIMARSLGGEVEKSENREYGKTDIIISNNKSLFAGLPAALTVWMSHGDKVISVPQGFTVTASSTNSPVVAMEDTQRKLYGLQFHPEVIHTHRGQEIMQNFVYRICGCSGQWTMKSFIASSVEEIRAAVGNEKVVCGVSGGVDSSVAAVLVHKAIGDQLICVFVNNGVLRKGEAEMVIKTFQENFHINLRYEDAEALFLEKLSGVIDPEEKRRIVGNEFIRVFENATVREGAVKFLAQGTLYPDVIESRSPWGSPSATIKSHHNVGGLPEDMEFSLVEPLRELFKDEVRLLGKELGMPGELIWRQPFPGPGLAVRIIGNVTKERLDLLREADIRVVEEIHAAGIDREIWQFFAVLLPVKTVGVMGDERTYEHVVALRVVNSIDGMTADWVRLPYEILECISNRIINEVKGINRVVYDISSKPPSTIEWE